MTDYFNGIITSAKNYDSSNSSSSDKKDDW